MGRRGFTLVELLVVISIISVLAGMIMPSLVVAQSRARAISCRSRLHQIGIAFEVYVIQHGEYLPGIADYTGKQFFGRYYGPNERVDFSAGYLSDCMDGDWDVWQCPTFDQFVPRAKGRCCSYAYNYNYLTKYKDNGLGWFDPGYKWWYRGLQMAMLKKPSRTVLFGDSAQNWLGPLEENWYYTPSEGLPWGLKYTHFRHMGYSNVLWGDNHVSAEAPYSEIPVDKDGLGVLCDTSDELFDPEK